MKLNQLLRWDLPKSKIPFLTQDGSAEIQEVAKYLGISVDIVKDAAFPEGRNGEGRIKERVIMYELISNGNTEIQISAIGGHGFPVFTPPGHCLVSILSSGRHQITPLYHKTEAVKAIKTAFIYG